jgi:hypothetical protein
MSLIVLTSPRLISWRYNQFLCIEVHMRGCIVFNSLFLSLSSYLVFGKAKYRSLVSPCRFLKLAPYWVCNPPLLFVLFWSYLGANSYVLLSRSMRKISFSKKVKQVDEPNKALPQSQFALFMT